MKINNRLLDSIRLTDQGYNSKDSHEASDDVWTGDSSVSSDNKETAKAYRRSRTENGKDFYGHVKRCDADYVGRKVLEMQSSPKRRRGKPKRRYLNVVKEDMRKVRVREE